MDREPIDPKILEDICPPSPEYPIVTPPSPPSNEDKAILEELALQCWLEGGDI